MMTDRKIIASAEVVSEIVKILNASAAIIYLMLLGHRNGRTGECYVTQNTIAEETNLSDRSVRTSLNKLKEAGFLEWKQGSSFSSKANSYIFLKERFDAEGKGEAIEAKKLRAKNKEQKIIENSKKKNECKIIQMPVPNSTAAKIALNKMSPAPPQPKIETKEKSAPVKKEKDKMPAEIKTLLNEYKSLLNKRNENIESKDKYMKDTCSDAVKHYIEKGDIKTALLIIEPEVQRLKNEFYIKENGLERLRHKDAEKVCKAFKEEFTSDFNRRIENYIFLDYSAASIVIEVKNYIEKKGLEFDLNKILAS